MRIVFKILLFPVVFVLSMLVWFCRAICWFSSGVLSLTSFVFFALGIVALFVLSVCRWQRSGSLTG